jgi:hypothetical protein
MTDQITPWEHTDLFAPGTTIRAAPVNAKFSAIAENLTSVAQFANTKAISFRDAPAKSVIEALTLNSFMYINGAGEVALYPKGVFDSEIQTALDAAADAGEYAAAALVSENNAKASEIAAAASAEIAQSVAGAIAGGAFFAGDWNASTGVYPAAPEEGSSIWRASTDGTGATAALVAGDYIIWDIVATTFRPMPGMPRVLAANAATALDIARIETKADAAIALAAAGL